MSSKLPRQASILISAIALLVFVGPARIARADRVDGLVSQMLHASDYKVRLSAALSLTKIGDTDAIPGFISALRDDNRTIRGVAATALGKLVDGRTRSRLRARALHALELVAKRDRNRVVRRRAQLAINKIGQESQPRPRAPGRGGVYVNIGAMSNKASGGRRMAALMHDAATRAIRDKGAGMATEWPGGRPSARDLQARGASGFYVDGTLTSLTAEDGGGGTVVACQVSLLLATYPAKSMFGFLKGGARVETGSSERSIDRGKQDCVSAVVESLVVRKIIPTIRSQAR